MRQRLLVLFPAFLAGILILTLLHTVQSIAARTLAPETNSASAYQTNAKDSQIPISSQSINNVFTETVAWVQLFPATSPPPRLCHEMAYDSARGVTVLFGGGDRFSPLGDTWIWNGTNWIELNPNHSPSSRRLHAMAYESDRGVVVLFGGNDGSTQLDDTWEWNGSNWVERFPTTAPSARTLQTMTYDDFRTETILFGGYSGQHLNDTWVWDGTDWFQRFPQDSPSERASAGMAFDSWRGASVLFGGPDDETWEWDGDNWTQRLPSNHPPARSDFGVAFDPDRGKTVIFGGWFNHVPMSDTWEWDGVNWVKISSPVTPTARYCNEMVYHEANQYVLMFGENNGSHPNDTWVYGRIRLEASPSERTVSPGQTAVYTMSTDGMAIPFTLTASSLPPKVSYQFFPSPLVTPPADVTLVLTTAATTPAGDYPFNLCEHRQGFSLTIPLTLRVVAIPDFRITPESSSWMMYLGTTITRGVSLTKTATFTGPVAMALSGLPLGIESAISQNPVTPDAEIDISLSGALSVTTGTYPLIISGIGDTISGTMHVPITRTALVTLNVLPLAITPTVSPVSRTAYQLQTTTYSVSLDATPGVTQPAGLAIEGLDAVDFQLGPDSISPGELATLAITTTLITTPTDYYFTVTTSSGRLTGTAHALLTVLPASLTPLISPSTQTIHQAQSAIYSVSVEATPGLTKPVTLRLSGLSDVDYSLVTWLLPPGGATTLVVTTTLDTAPGQRAFSITAGNGDITGTTGAYLVVLPASVTPLITPSSRTVYQCESALYSISVDATPGLTLPITLTVDGLDGAVGTIWPNPLPLGETADLTVKTSIGTPPGNRVFTVTAYFAGLAGQDSATLNVLPADITLEVSPSSRSIFRGQETNYTVALAATPGFTLPASLSVGGLPDGTSYSFVPPAVSPGGSSSLLIDTTRLTPPALYQVSITATVGDIVRSIDALLEAEVGLFLPLTPRRWPPIPYEPFLYSINNPDGDDDYTLIWTEQPERLAETYLLQEATNSNFTTGVRTVCTTVGQSCNVADNPPGTYYYRVRGQNTWGHSNWSNTRSTTVLPPPIENGDFEQGPGVGWYEYSSHGWPIILSRDFLPVPPRSGDWAAWLGGEYEEVSIIGQQVTIPTDNPVLTFWYWIASQDFCGYDFGGVIINLDTVVDAFDLCDDEDTNGWVLRMVDLVDYAGQSVELEIVAVTDESLNSNLFVDDVALGGDAFSDSPTTEAFPEGDWKEDKETVLPIPQ